MTIMSEEKQQHTIPRVLLTVRWNALSFPSTGHLGFINLQWHSKLWLSWLKCEGFRFLWLLLLSKGMVRLFGLMSYSTGHSSPHTPHPHSSESSRSVLKDVSGFCSPWSWSHNTTFRILNVLNMSQENKTVAKIDLHQRLNTKDWTVRNC